MSTFDGTYPGGNKLFVVRFAILSLDSVACTVRQKTEFLKKYYCSINVICRLDCLLILLLLLFVCHGE